MQTKALINARNEKDIAKEGKRKQSTERASQSPLCNAAELTTGIISKLYRECLSETVPWDVGTA